MYIDICLLISECRNASDTPCCAV